MHFFPILEWNASLMPKKDADLSLWFSQKTLKPVRRPLDAEFTHLFIHAGPGDAQGAGRLGDVPVVIAEGEEVCNRSLFPA